MTPREVGYDMRKPRMTRTLAAALLLVLAGCSERPSAVRTVETPARPGSLAPNLAAGLDGRLYLSWIEPSGDGHALRFATWEAGAWSEPGTVAVGHDWFVNWADFPSLAALEDGTLAAQWLVRNGESTYAYDVVLALSHDGGRTWSEPIRPHRDGTPTEHGFVSMVPRPDGKFGIVWLDGRDTLGTPRGPMTLRYTTLSADGALGAESLIDDSVCDCCSTDALRSGDGKLLVAYRDRTSSELRDISVCRGDETGWSAPGPVHEDRWEIAACPVNGPAVAGEGDDVAVVWYTAAEDPTVRVAFSGDGGRTFGPPLRVDEGSPLGRVDVLLLDDGAALVSWLEEAEDQARILLRRVDPSKADRASVVTTTSAARAGGFPRMARVEDGVVLTWTEVGEPSRVVTAWLPR